MAVGGNFGLVVLLEERVERTFLWIITDLL